MAQALVLPELRFACTGLLPLRWVMSASVERVASADSPGAFERTDKRAVFSNCLNKVVAATGRKTAIASQQWTQADLVEADTSDHDPARQTYKAGPQKSHEDAFFASFASRQQSRGKDA